MKARDLQRELARLANSTRGAHRATVQAEANARKEAAEASALVSQNTALRSQNAALKAAIVADERQRETSERNSSRVSVATGGALLRTSRVSAAVLQLRSNQSGLEREVVRLTREDERLRRRAAALKPVEVAILRDDKATRSLSSQIVLLTKQVHKADALLHDQSEAHLKALLQRAKDEQTILASDVKSEEQRAAALQFKLRAVKAKTRKLRARIKKASAHRDAASASLVAAKALVRENRQLHRRHAAAVAKLAAVRASNKVLGQQVLVASGANPAQAAQDSDAFADVDPAP